MRIRDLIKNILKEDLYNKETKKGIDIAIKILKQDYPYIIGWDFDDEYPTTIDLFIVCDIEEAQKFYNSELRPYYLKNKDMLKSDEYAYVVSVLEIGHEMTSDEKFEDYKKLSNKLNDIYEMLPDELVIKDRWKDAKILAVDKFTFR
jgi:beta-galactosidase GanA